MNKFILFSAVAVSLNVFAWDFKIENKTSSKIKVNVNYNTGTCSDDEVLIDGFGNKTIKTGWCCASSYKVTGLDKSLKGKSKQDTTSLCRHILTVTQDDAGNLAVNDDKW